MNYSIIIRPLIGAGIGYITNWIAVKMMFRPLKPVKIGNFTLPFTPGIIPKNKERLAEAIGDSISNNLLTEETLKNTLLSDSVKSKIKENIITFLDSSSKNETPIREIISSYISENNFNEVIEIMENNLTSSIFETVKNSNLGNVVAEQLIISAKEKLKGSILGLVGGKAIISAISENAEIKINEYLDSNGKELINKMVVSEVDKISNSKVSDISAKLNNSSINFANILMNIYENFITEKLPEIIKFIDISNIVKEKINSMDILELEKLILFIMKKELNALVNLGALIGFILGMINLLF